MVVQVDLVVLCLQVFQEGQGHPVATRQSHSQLCTWEEALPVSGARTLGPCLPGKPGTPGGPR